MKIKEKIHRLLVAKEQWLTANRLQDKSYLKYTASSVCSQKLINRLIKEYGEWEAVEIFHCCYGWERSCWEDYFYEGAWDYTDNDVAIIIADVLKSIRKDSRRFPVFYICEKNGIVDILVTNRHKNGTKCTDWIIEGKSRNGE